MSSTVPSLRLWDLTGEESSEGEEELRLPRALGSWLSLLLWIMFPARLWCYAEQMHGVLCGWDEGK